MIHHHYSLFFIHFLSKSVVGKHCLGFRLFTAQEALHAFHLVVGFEAIAKQFFFNRNSLVDGLGDALVDGLLAVADCDGSILGNLICQLHHVLHQFSLRVNSVDQADTQSFVCLDVQGRVNQLLCHAHANQAGQTLGCRRSQG